MAFYRLKNWETYQHYKYKNETWTPTWVKLYRKLLESEVWVMGSDSRRVLVVSLLILAARTRNHIPANPDYIMRMCNLNEKPDVDLGNLASLEFIELCEENDASRSPLEGVYTSSEKVIAQNRIEENRIEKKKKETPASEKAARFVLSDLLHGKLQEEDLLLQSYEQHRGLIENMFGILVVSHKLKRPSDARAFLQELGTWPIATVVAVAKSLSEWDQKFFVGPKAIRTMLEKQAAQNIKPRKVDAHGKEIEYLPGRGP